ncbi:MAG: GNAT family N-acetyltransferase [Pseudomonadota bacterium]
MSQRHFRRAIEADIAAMAALRLSVRENRLSDPSRVTLADYHDYLERLGRGWVCEIDGVLAGFSYADKRDGSIWALFVDPTLEGRGIGKGLLALAVDYLFSLGHASVVLSTGADTRADAFYAAQGWIRSVSPNQSEVRYALLR